MIKHKQLYKHVPEHGIYGDCLRTVYACLLDKSPEDIPNFGEYWENIRKWEEEEHKWLDKNGLVNYSFPFDGSLNEVLNFQGKYFKDKFWILTGTSKNKVNHVVICMGNKIYWDTSIDNSGIEGPADDGFYWISILMNKSNHIIGE